MQSQGNLRREVAASWRRVAACGLGPSSNPPVAPLGEDELERRRTCSGLRPLVPTLLGALQPVIDAGQLVVVSDPDARVLWRAGGSAVRTLADGLGFVGGSAWTEGNVGTNAIGTSLVLGEPVSIRGPEHFVESHTRWGCAAAPVLDPASGATLGAVDVSGPVRGMHPAELALVQMAARLASLEFGQAGRAELDRLRAHAAPLLARMRGRALALLPDGRVAAAVGMVAPDRVALPERAEGGTVWLPGLGAACLDPVPGGGWLARLGDTEQAPVTSVDLDLRDVSRLEVSGPSGRWAQPLTRRHAEVLLALAVAGPEGRTATALAQDLFADPGRTVTVRAELSRMRRTLGSLLLTRPYRFLPSAQVRVLLPEDRRAVLPGSSAPVVVGIRSVASAP